MSDYAEELYNQAEAFYNAGNYPVALSFYEEAMRLGSLRAMFDVGWCYSHGKGAAKNYQKSMDAYCQYIDKGGANLGAAFRWVGTIFELGGYGVKRDIARALRCYSAAAKHGDAWGYLLYGSLLKTHSAEGTPERAEALSSIQTAMQMAPKDDELQKIGRSRLRW